MCSISIFILHFTYLGVRLRTQRTPPLAYGPGFRGQLRKRMSGFLTKLE